jgi:hypothetical protein
MIYKKVTGRANTIMKFLTIIYTLNNALPAAFFNKRMKKFLQIFFIIGTALVIASIVILLTLTVIRILIN